MEKMSIPDAHEDAATMAASAVLELMKRSDIMPKRSARFTWALNLQWMRPRPWEFTSLECWRGLWPGIFQECSTVEFKSACIGASYALESIVEWVGSGARSGPAPAPGAADGQGDDRIGIVIASDVARYELENSRGVYPGRWISGYAGEEGAQVGGPGRRHRIFYQG